MIYVLSHEQGRNTDNAMDKFTSDFNRIYPQIGKVFLFKNRKGRLKIVPQMMDAFLLTIYGLKCINDSDYLMLKFPFTKTLVYSTRIIRKFKKCRIITVLEDVNYIRYGRSEDIEVQRAVRELGGSNFIMSPNNGYINRLKRDISNSQFVNFKMYPYTVPDKCQARICVSDFNKGEICFAGNLNKSVFLKKLSFNEYKLSLYGSCTESNARLFENKRNVVYFGSFGQDDLIEKIANSQYGLVWDGTDLNINFDTSGLGKYLQYNTSSKFCLYLSIGLPVIVWEKAAVAEYVVENNCGVILQCLEDLEQQLNNISEVRYEEMRKNAVRVSERIRNGQDFIETVNRMVVSQE